MIDNEITYMIYRGHTQFYHGKTQKNYAPQARRKHVQRTYNSK